MKKEYYLYVILSSTILGIPAVYAACVPTPDCEELGYTATECSEGGVKCPWDTTKLFCGPSCNLTTTKADCDANCLNVGTQSCSKNGVTYYGGCGVSKCTSGQSCVSGTCTCDSIYKYACSGTGYAGGVGTACGGKYQSCNCAQDYEWKNGACSLACDSSYQYTCSGANITGGSGTACGGKYTACTCSSPYTWSSGACSCPSTYKYACTGTGYSGGSGTACGGKYQSCTCASGYTWGGGACCSNSYKYTCTSGSYVTGGSGSACNGKYTACSCSSPRTWSNGSCICSSSYKYTCSGTGYSGGSGTACGGKYTSCNCSSGYSWNGSSCRYCGSSYKYTCSGSNISGGSGSACGGKYTACTCASGYVWKNGACSCDKTCSVGNILYSDYTCSSCNVSGKTPIGVVSYISGGTRLAINLVNASMGWGRDDISGITNYSSSSAALNDFSGKANTAAWISYYGSSVTNYAPGYCYNYTTAGTSKGQWYLPAAGELYASIATNYSAVNNGIKAAGGTQLLLGAYYWSSSEYSDSSAWAVYPTVGTTNYRGKNFVDGYVRCVLAF